MFNACAIVPSYNHHRAVAQIVGGLRTAGLPVFVVDDGSDEPARSVLAGLHAPADGVVVHRNAANLGKGGAVIQGFGLASAAGFSHALQIDADGQHDLSAVGGLLAVARANPEALVVGAPIFDGSIPRARRIGRRLTNFWICVERLSTKAVDAMCGFRAYPIAPVMELLERESVRRGMDFDIDVLVRLAWRGLPILEAPVRVTYPSGNTSNFNLVRDNWRITKTHTRLVLTMPFRLFGRRTSRGHGAPRHWAAMSERGIYWGLRFSAGAYKIGGLRGCMAALWPIMLYFYATGAEQRAASRVFLRRAFAAQGSPRDPNWRERVRHFRSFTQKAVETFGAWVDGPKDGALELADDGEIGRVVSAGRGIVMIVSHLGNAELSRALVDRERQSRILLLVHTRHAESYNRVLRRFRPEAAVNTFQVDEIGPDTILKLKEFVDQGHWVAIAGDRTPISGGGRVSRAPFLGHDAPFPQGPYVLAHLLGCPVYLMFCLREAGRHRVYFEKFADRVALPAGSKDAALADLAGRYARRLEAFCLKDPFQWYNFFEFWAPASSVETPIPS